MYRLSKPQTAIYEMDRFGGISAPEKKLCELDILSAEEYNRVVYEFNDTAVDYPKEKTVHQLFEEQVEKTPDKTAVIACDKTSTYSELNEQANRIAHGLIEKGVGIGDIVALMLPRRSFLIAAMFGVLKAGAAYMPIDPDYPQERIATMLNVGNVKILLSESSMGEVIFNGETTFIHELLNNCSSDNANIALTAEDLFCALHTSGSTGTPKCALLMQKNMMNFIAGNTYLLDGIDYTIAINTVTFDVFEMDTVFSIVGGVTCVLASENQQYVQTNFEEMMSGYFNCLFWATPTKITSYINNSETKAFVKRINNFVCGGEIFTSELASTIKSLNKSIEIYTVCGPTETLIYSSLQHLVFNGYYDSTEGTIYVSNSTPPHENSPSPF